MEKFKIKDFNTAFQIGIEKLVMDSVNQHSKNKKNPGKVKATKLVKILKSEIFVSYRFKFNAKRIDYFIICKVFEQIIYLNLIQPKLGIDKDLIDENDIRWIKNQRQKLIDL